MVTSRLSNTHTAWETRLAHITGQARAECLRSFSMVGADIVREDKWPFIHKPKFTKAESSLGKAGIDSILSQMYSLTSAAHWLLSSAIKDLHKACPVVSASLHWLKDTNKQCHAYLASLPSAVLAIIILTIYFVNLFCYTFRVSHPLGSTEGAWEWGYSKYVQLITMYHDYVYSCYQDA